MFKCQHITIYLYCLCLFFNTLKAQSFDYDDGELFLIVADQLAGNQDSVTINELGIAEDNFLDFEEGIDFLDSQK